MTIKQAHKELMAGHDIILRATTLHGVIGGCERSITLEHEIYGYESRYEALKHTVECWKFDNKPFVDFRLEVVEYAWG